MTSSKSKSKINVLQIIDNLDIGGAQEVVRTLVEYLKSEQCTPFVCTFRDGPFRQSIEDLGITVEVLPSRRYGIVAFPMYILDMISIFRSLVAVIKKHKIDVIQTHLLKSLNFLVFFLQYATPLKATFITFHNVFFELNKDQLKKLKWLVTPKNITYRTLYRFIASRVSGFISVSDEVEKAMVRVLGPKVAPKITTIVNGVDMKRYDLKVDKTKIKADLGLEANATLLAVVATLKEQKGHRYFVEAMHKLVPKFPTLHALFIGDGVLREELQAQVAKLNLTEHIHFLGSRHDIPQLLAASDIFVLPSLWEGLAMALLEAGSAALPIVASEVSGTVQVINHTEHGLLISPADPEQCAQAIAKLLSDPEYAQTLGQAAKTRIREQFSAEKQAKEHIDLFRRFL